MDFYCETFLAPLARSYSLLLGFFFIIAPTFFSRLEFSARCYCAACVLESGSIFPPFSSHIFFSWTFLWLLCCCSHHFSSLRQRKAQGCLLLYNCWRYIRHEGRLKWIFIGEAAAAESRQAKKRRGRKMEFPARKEAHRREAERSGALIYIRSFCFSGAEE